MNLNLYILDGGEKGIMTAFAVNELDARLLMMENIPDLYEKISEVLMIEEPIEYGVVYHSYGGVK